MRSVLRLLWLGRAWLLGLFTCGAAGWWWGEVAACSLAAFLCQMSLASAPIALEKVLGLKVAYRSSVLLALAFLFSTPFEHKPRVPGTAAPGVPANEGPGGCGTQKQSGRHAAKAAPQTPAAADSS